MRALIIAVLFSLALPAFAAAQQTVNAKVTCYAPGGGGIQGGFVTSRRGPNNGPSIPRTLDDFRLGKSNYVTLAAHPSRYGQWFDMGSVSYVSNLDGRQYTISKAIGYVHDTGSAFWGPNERFGKEVSTCVRYRTCNDVHRKFDVAYGDFRGKSQNLGLVYSNSYCANKDTTWTQIGGPLTTPPTVTAGDVVADPLAGAKTPLNPYTGAGNPYTGAGNPKSTPIPSQPAQSAYYNQPGTAQPTQYFPQQQGSALGGPTTFPSNLYQPASVADKLLDLLKNPTTTISTSTATTSIVITSAEDVVSELYPAAGHDSAPSSLPLPEDFGKSATSPNTFTSSDLSGRPNLVPQQQSTVVSAFATVLDFLTNALLRIMDALRNLVN